MTIKITNATAFRNRRNGLVVKGDIDVDVTNFHAEQNGLDGILIEGGEKTPSPPSKKRRLGRFLASVGQGALGGALGNLIS